jgi:hypothetical protein
MCNAFFISTRPTFLDVQTTWVEYYENTCFHSSCATPVCRKTRRPPQFCQLISCYSIYTQCIVPHLHTCIQYESPAAGQLRITSIRYTQSIKQCVHRASSRRRIGVCALRAHRSSAVRAGRARRMQPVTPPPGSSAAASGRGSSSHRTDPSQRRLLQRCHMTSFSRQSRSVLLCFRACTTAEDSSNHHPSWGRRPPR